MQKLARRVATAERVVAKRNRAKEHKFYRHEKKQNRRQTTAVVGQAADDIRRAKKAIQDDWAMGTLSPRSDVGDYHDALGSIRTTRYGTNATLTLAQRNARCEWAGNITYLNLAEGDRVVLLDGPDKGRIGNVSGIDLTTAELTVRDLNKSNVLIPEEMRVKNSPTSGNMELPIPISAVRLVHPITDPATGKTRDVIINQLVRSGAVTDRQTGKRRWDRVVPGLNISIPWPPKDELDKPDYKADTLRIDVEQRTFVPTLLRPPMPEAVIDELRGKYSRFRTRHEPEYIARIEAEDQAQKDRAQLMDSMRTPLQEFHRAEREKKKKKGKPRLTMEMLEKIGEVIARSRERTLNANISGLSYVPPPPPLTDLSPDVPPPPPPTSTSTSTDTQPSAPPPST
ncbi:hypothetical protein F4859DRAFT_515289 [Xylaria cf. heliscus]|nr:hypothetical protein F4859DRAFT_515289 [Xylaria cf. heliscus]